MKESLKIFKLSYLPATSYKLTANRGFTILYAVLVGALALSLGLTIFNITIKQLTLSATGRESQSAFYAADSGVECAFYSDLVLEAFPTTTNRSAGEVTCDYNPSQTPPVVTVGGNSSEVTSAFTLYLNPGPACAVISVVKTPDSNGDGYSDTVLESRGRNDCLDVDSLKRVERAIRVKY